MICVLLLAAGHPWESVALARLEQVPGATVLKRCVDVEDLLAAATTGQADVALVALDAPGLDPAAVHHLWRHAVRAVGVTDHAADDLDVAELARQLGIESVTSAADFGGLAEVVSRVEEASAPDRGQAGGRTPAAAGIGEPATGGRGRHRTIAVWGPTGAPGRTTVATSLAAELAGRSRPVTIVDLDPYGGSVAQQLGILDEVSGVLAGARLATSGQLGERFDSICRRVEDDLVVVTGLPRADRWREVRAAHVDQLLDVAGGRGDVVIDTGFCLEDDASDFGGRPSRNTMTLGALEAADEVVVVGSADPVGLARLARSLVELGEHHGSLPIRVVVNRMRPTIGWSPREVAAMVEGFSRSAGLHFLPEDRPGIDRALVTGRAAVAVAGTEFRTSIAGLADALVPTSAGQQVQRLRRRVPLMLSRSLPRQRTAGRALLR